MNPRELFLLSPYRLSTHHSVTLGDDEAAAFLNGYAALWHPALLRGAAAAPRVVSPYEYEQPTAGHIYSVPQTPPPLLPDDWEERATAAGAAFFAPSADRSATLEAALKALASLEPNAADAPSLAAAEVSPFLGLGFAHLQLQALAEAMSHEYALDPAAFWQAVQQAALAVCAGDREKGSAQLQEAAKCLTAAREVMYPVTIHLIHLRFLDKGVEPAAASFDLAANLLLSGAELERLARQNPAWLAAARAGVASGSMEICSGCYLDRDDSLLPVESQLWNLHKGLALSRRVLDKEPQTFAAQHAAVNPRLAALLDAAGLTRAVLLPLAEVALPSTRSPVVSWPAPSGKSVQVFTRAAADAGSPQTYFNLVPALHETIMHDHVATLVLRSQRGTAPWLDDWLALSRLAPVLGQWTTLSRYLDDVPAGEEITPTPDDFSADALADTSPLVGTTPVSGYADHVRRRRRIDTAWTLAAMYRALTGSGDVLAVDASLADLEDRMEAGSDPDPDLRAVEQKIAAALAERLLVRAQSGTPGYLFLNPCNFARRVAIELDETIGPLAVAGPLKAWQPAGQQTRLVVEIPALGFSWVPRSSSEGPSAPASRMQLADENHVRNEFFEAEIDPATGGLRGIWDQRTRVSRLGQQLIYQPGSRMRASARPVATSGPALGEIVTTGDIVDEHDEVLAHFRQRFRAWLGRPVLEMDIEIEPLRPPTGYPWHAYYGARFAWRDAHAYLLRGVGGIASVTEHTRPVTPDYLEIRQGKQATILFPGGLPFLQRHGTRMLDLILIVEGESARRFHIGIGLDRDYPTHTAFGFVSPITMVPVAKGPPTGGASGWLFHLDASNVLLTSMRPSASGADGVSARLLECGGANSRAALHCPRNPIGASLLDLRSVPVGSAQTSGDAALFEMPQGGIVQLQVDFS